MGLYKSKNLTSAKRTHQTYLGKYVRLRDSDSDGMLTCCTCGRREHRDSGKMNAGHCIEAQVEFTVSNEFNVHPQCVPCNQSENGRAAIHAKYIMLQHGETIFYELVAMAQQPMEWESPKDRIEWYMQRARHWKEQYEYLLEARSCNE